MKVYKFGGASVSTVGRIKNVGEIIKRCEGEQLLIVVSAIGKTTNALEKVSEAFYAGNNEEALQLFEELKQQHIQILNELVENTVHASNALINFFTEVEWLLHDKPVRHYDYYYDQIVCVGELLSTAIVSKYLSLLGIKNQWVDVRDIIRTDNNFRDASIDWKVTQEKADSEISSIFIHTDIVITQGFIGATDENESTTLGREGSDYTAAVFANLLNAENQTIWKDVQGVMNADPKEYAKAQWIKELNYTEVIEMAYYGAQVIHPKTIKPLQNKNIPLFVKSFINPVEEGTIIHKTTVSDLPPIIVYKRKQVLVELKSKDFSFVSEGLSAKMFAIFEQLHFKPNLTQNAAITLLLVVDDIPEKVENLALSASEFFDVTVTKDLCLLTIRHYNNDVLEELGKQNHTILKQQTPDTIQMLMKN